MIRPCTPADFADIHQIINDAAQAYRGIIPADRWHEPYMPEDELRRQIDEGVVFSGIEIDDRLAAVMGIQRVRDVDLIRHAYVRTIHRNRGLGSQLLKHLCAKADRPILIGTWAAATWAITFYQKHGFRLVSTEEKNLLLRKYWSIPDRQIETSVVLADGGYRSQP